MSVRNLADDHTTRNGRAMFRNFVGENKEIITRPAITLIPSIFSVFSLPFLIGAFILGCRNVETQPVRYLLITFYFIPFIPQMVTFLVHIYPSSFYRREWQSTMIYRRTRQFGRHQPTLSVIGKDKYLKTNSACLNERISWISGVPKVSVKNKSLVLLYLSEQFDHSYVTS